MIVIYVVIAIFLLTVIFGAPYVPSRSKDLDVALKELYPVSCQDVLLDIGCGDGRVLKKASSLGAKTIGYEINPILAFISKARSPKSKIHLKDFRYSKLPLDTTVIYVFGIERIMKSVFKSAKNIARIRQKPVYIISYGFEIKNADYHKKLGAYYLYKVN